MVKYKRSKILRLVRQIAKIYGHKVVITSDDPTTFGERDIYTNTIKLSTHVRYGGPRSKLYKVTEAQMEDTALHELAHVMQMARGDTTQSRCINGHNIYWWDQAVAEGTHKLTKRFRSKLLKMIWDTEIEAEQFSIDMRRRLGRLKDPHTEARKSTRTLLTYILRLHFGVNLTPRETAKLMRRSRLRLVREIPSLQETINMITEVIPK